MILSDILFILPNIAATLYLVKEKAYQANLLYFIGYILMIAHNYQNGDTTQIIYFTLLWVLTCYAVFKHNKTSHDYKELHVLAKIKEPD